MQSAGKEGNAALKFEFIKLYDIVHDPHSYVTIAQARLRLEKQAADIKEGQLP